jgi:putative ABC transport system substrate-binding protein
MIVRRQFITLLGGAAAWPLAARAQQATVPVIGFLNSGSSAEQPSIEAFRQGLAETGYVDGRNVHIEYRWAEGRYERMPALAAELVEQRVTVIAALGTPAAPAAKAATATIPIVFRIGVDPVELGLVASFNRPGGNLTGVVSLNAELEAKRLEILHELVPTATSVALLVNPSSLNTEVITKNARAASSTYGLQLRVVEASTERDFDIAFASAATLQVGALMIAADPFLANRSKSLAAASVRHRIPTMAADREFVTAGGLASYGSSGNDSYRLAGVFVGRVLKGDKPADLPVQQSTKIELTINLKTAKALGLTVPQTLLVAADEVIE